MVQVSMDGPNVNKKCLRDLIDYLNNLSIDDSVQLLEIGTCILHTIHGSFKTGHDKFQWDVNAFCELCTTYLKIF